MPQPFRVVALRVLLPHPRESMLGALPFSQLLPSRNEPQRSPSCTNGGVCWDRWGDPAGFPTCGRTSVFLSPIAAATIASKRTLLRDRAPPGARRRTRPLPVVSPEVVAFGSRAVVNEAWVYCSR